tara:strand:+ start:704 stop:1405 length:702 start_codon:yes stop_codon:yes gene_type:complete
VTAKLCQHIGIKKTLISLQKFNEKSRINTILSELQNGKTITLVSDAGTPLISDPGSSLVSAVREAGISIVPIPGPSAVTTLLSAAGVSADQYLFAGFFPKKKQEVVNFFDQLDTWENPIVFFDSPKRIIDSLTTLQAIGGISYCCVGKELTKAFETIFSGSLDDVIKKMTSITIKGEFCFLIKKEKKEKNIDQELLRLMLSENFSKKQITKITTHLGYPKNTIYENLLQLEKE